jgi:hypothetical protein
MKLQVLFIALLVISISCQNIASKKSGGAIMQRLGDPRGPCKIPGKSKFLN